MAIGMLKKPKMTTCVVCGNKFMQRATSEKMCGEDCRHERKLEWSRNAGKGKSLSFRIKRDIVNPKCAVCGWSGPAVETTLHGHHIIPRSWGGANSEENIVLLCPNHHALAHSFCNGRKSQQFIDVVLRQKTAFIEHLKSYDSDPAGWVADYHRTLIDSVRGCCNENG